MTTRRLRSERLLVAALAVLVLILSGVFFLLQRAGRASPQFLASSLLLYALAMVNVILVLVLLFVLFRNLIKLMVERRRGVLGSRFRAKMVFTFIALTLLPAVVLYAAALYLIQLSAERWFSTPVDDITRTATELVADYHDSVKVRTEDFAWDLAEGIRRGRLLDADQLPQLRRQMRVGLQLRRLDLLQVRSRDEELVAVVTPQVPLEDLSEIPDSLLAGVFRGESFQWMERLGAGFLVRAGVPVRSAFNDDVVAVVVTGQRIPEDLTARTTFLAAASENYRQLKVGRIPMKRVYEFTFTLLGLLLVFAATWVGLFLARGYTVPVQALAEGTREIAAGNLDHQVEVEARDEMGILVESFNRMIRELRHGREEIERSNLELQRSNIQLEERRRYTETLLQNLTTGVISLDGEGKITTMNRAAYRVLRLEGSDEAVGRRYAEMLVGEGFEPLREFLDRARQAGDVSATREFHFGAEGRNLSLSATVSSLEDPRRGTGGLLVVLEDLTQLIRAQRVAAWREVARRMAHEIKNPLTPIQLSAQRIAKKSHEGSPDLPQVVREGTDTIITEVNALKTLVNEFSRYARLPEVRPAPTDIHQVIDSALGLYDKVHPEVRFSRRFDAGAPAVAADQEQMKRVFVNLVENALEAMDRRGEIQVTTEYLPQLGLLRVEVADDGPGIPPADRERLFLPSFSTKRRGTGLGLAIVNRIISDHHGGIRVEDNLPHGARFVIDLPAEAA